MNDEVDGCVIDIERSRERDRDGSNAGKRKTFKEVLNIIHYIRASFISL